MFTPTEELYNTEQSLLEYFLIDLMMHGLEKVYKVIIIRAHWSFKDVEEVKMIVRVALFAKTTKIPRAIYTTKPLARDQLLTVITSREGVAKRG